MPHWERVKKHLVVPGNNSLVCRIEKGVPSDLYSKMPHWERVKKHLTVPGNNSLVCRIEKGVPSDLYSKMPHWERVKKHLAVPGNNSPVCGLRSGKSDLGGTFLRRPKAPRRAGPAPDRLRRKGGRRPQSSRRPPEGRAPRRTGFAEREEGDHRAREGPQKGESRAGQASQKGGKETAGPEGAPRRASPAPDRLHRRGARRPQGQRRPPEPSYLDGRCWPRTRTPSRRRLGARQRGQPLPTAPDDECNAVLAVQGAQRRRQLRRRGRVGRRWAGVPANSTIDYGWGQKSLADFSEISHIP
jgi:hypothetical protein